ncbi:DNA ligase 1-like [Salvia divinorum]|uniref:DNA ligase 1-like n=1 Tax=Salvia divinorum TaxID=28513 RepID=A0ABD1GF79_SALDI
MADGDVEKQALELQLERAVIARLQHFKDQADSLTLESVRRLLEKDLGLENFTLDAHKRFIRHFLEKIMEGADESNSNPTTGNMDKDEQSSMEEEKVLPKQQEAKSNPLKPCPGNEKMMEDSPIMGVLTAKSVVDTQPPLNESRVKKAILERAGHLQANSHNISLAGVRRLLEEDIGLDKNTLDAFKNFISQQVDQVLKGAKSGKDVKKKVDVKRRKLKKVNNEEDSDAPLSESDEMSYKVRTSKVAAPKRNLKNSEQPKKRKISENADIEVSPEKTPSKLAKRQKEEDNNSVEDESLSEDGQSQSSVERSALQRKEKSTPVYGKQVENLKSIIKACGMSIPPVIYKKAKQAPDDRRETIVVKELEDILSREGLSKNPTEKEIKDCRKRKERAKELEGIDMSNIISSSRRRSTFSFVAPDKPLVRGEEMGKEKEVEEEKEKEKDDAEEEKEKEESEEEEEDDGDDEEQDDGDESEEFDADDDEESD